MSALLQAAALTCAALGLLSAGIVLATGREGRTALRVLLDFLLAAGLLGLGGDPGWAQVLAAALVVAVRRAV